MQSKIFVSCQEVDEGCPDQSLSLTNHAVSIRLTDLQAGLELDPVPPISGSLANCEIIVSPDTKLVSGAGLITIT